MIKRAMFGGLATCQVHEQTAAAATTTNAEKGSSISQQVLGVKKHVTYEILMQH